MRSLPTKPPVPVAAPHRRMPDRGFLISCASIAASAIYRNARSASMRKLPGPFCRRWLRSLQHHDDMAGPLGERGDGGRSTLAIAGPSAVYPDRPLYSLTGEAALLRT